MLALILGNGRLARMRKTGLPLFQGLRHARPELQPVRAPAHAAQLRWRALRVRNAAARSHPIDGAGLDRLYGADAVAMNDASLEEIGHGRQPDMRVRTDIVVPEGLELLGTEMIEEKERPHGLPFRGGKKAADLGLAHFPHSRLPYQDVSHLSPPAPPRHPPLRRPSAR